MEKYDCIVIGAGLAGLTCAYKLASENKKVLLIEKEKFVGGRTSSWNDGGFLVEAGFHRHIGFYKELPKILNEVGVELNDIVEWEKEAEIKINNNKKMVLGISPFHNPITFVKDILGNKEILSLKDKLSMSKLFITGFYDYKFHPKELDKYSVLDYSKKLNITNNVIEYVVTPLSTGIFFLPREKYSSKLFFGLFYPSLFHPISLRIGAYKGGMSDLIAEPIAKKFKELGGEILLNTKVNSLIIKNNKVLGVKLDKEIYSKCVVLATDIYNSKKLINNLKSENINKIKKLPTTSAITLHIELSKPMMPLDRTTFAPFTMMTSYTEESRTTFKNSKGRLSIILGNPDEYLKWSDEDILNKCIEEFKKIDIDIKDYILDYRVIRHENKFYNFGPNNDYLRPTTDSGIEGLVLAGDYTRQKMYATMEGAVISGINAYKFIIESI